MPSACLVARLVECSEYECCPAFLVQVTTWRNAPELSREEVGRTLIPYLRLGRPLPLMLSGLWNLLEWEEASAWAFLNPDSGRRHTAGVWRQALFGRRMAGAMI